MNPVMTLADQTLNDLALFAAIVAFSAVLVVAALWTAARLRVDRLLQVASREVGAWPKRIVAVIGVAGSLSILMGVIPSSLLLEPWAAGAAGSWIIMSVVAVSAALNVRRRGVQAAAATPAANAQELPAARAA